MDLHSASYQNHLGTSAQPYLSLITSFGGLCILAHSGQGLLRQSRSVIRRVDQHEASHNYATVIYKLNLTNLKVNPAKIHYFPESFDIACWIQRKGGSLEVSPHPKNSLFSTKEEHLPKVKHNRSFEGLYKTLHMVTLAISRVLAPLEEAVARKLSL